MPVRGTTPVYTYERKCGHGPFVSTTLSRADDDGWHWFPCRECKVVTVLAGDELGDAVPHKVDRRWGDGQIAKAVDQALIRERIVRMLRLWLGGVSTEQIARWAGCSVITVKRLQALEAERWGIDGH